MSATTPLKILIYPVAGEPFEVITTGFGSEDALLDRIAQAVDGGGALRMTGRIGESDETAMVFNVANIVGVRVLSPAADGTTGQYL